MSFVARLATCPKTQLLLCAGMAALGPSVATHLGLSGTLTAALGPLLAGLATQGGVVAGSALGEFIGGRVEATFEELQQNRPAHKVQQTLSGAVGLALADLIREFSHDHPEQKALQQIAGNAAERWTLLPSPPLADELSAQAFASAGPLTEDSLLARVEWPQVVRFLCRDTSGSGQSTGISLRLAVGAGTADALAAHLAHNFPRVLRTTLLRSASGDTGAWRQTVLYLLAELVQSGIGGGVSKADLHAAIEAQLKQLPATLLAELIPLIAQLKQSDAVLGEKLDALLLEVRESREFQESRTLFLEEELRRQSQMSLEVVQMARDLSQSKDVIIEGLKAENESLKGNLAEAKRNLLAVQSLAATIPPSADSFTLGLQAQATGDFPKAAQHFQRAIGEKIVSPIRVYLVQMRMAKHQGKLIEAGDWAEKAAQVCPDELGWLREIIIVLLDVGHFQTALRPSIQRVKLSLKMKGEEHRITQMSMSNLAALYCFLGQFENAKIFQEKTYKLQCYFLGEEHPETLLSMVNLDATYCFIGQHEESKELLEKTIEIQSRVLGVEHPDTLISISNLATTYHELGQFEKAKNLLEKSYISICRVLGETHPHALQAKENLDICLAALAGTSGEAKSVEEVQTPGSGNKPISEETGVSLSGTRIFRRGTRSEPSGTADES